ncbi:MAG: S53 family peptidase [Jatrophihabitans endophyticus]|nr:S53 family peptidase [Jatrophihabitans endophyticus]
MSHRVGRVTAAPPTTAQCRSKYGIYCYGAKQIEHAYDESPLFAKGIKGQGQTIVIVDAFGSPTIKHDLAKFDRTYHLSAPPSLKVIRPAGKFHWKANPTDEGWAGETTLDVEYSHTIAPKAKILLVETPKSEEEGRSGFPQIVRAENYVINHHLGGVISQSFGATEQSFADAQALLSLRSAYKNAAKHNVTVLTASGDSGATDSTYDENHTYKHPVTSWPDSDPLITGIGGTRLTLNGHGKHLEPDVAWNDTYNKALLNYFGEPGPTPLATGGGKSVIFKRPTWQRHVKSVVGSRRGVPDISMSGSCSGGVNTYQSFPGQPAGWEPTCGTSEATPLFAGIVALSEQVAHHKLGLINPALYKLSAEHAKGLVDVTSGNNTVTFTQKGKQYTVKGFSSRKGYDLTTGVGTVDAAKFVKELARVG